MAHAAEIFVSSIVAVGNFNPAIFSPDWLERNRLIGKEDADAAREGPQRQSLLISHQVAVCETKWFALQVLENQFSLTSKDALSPAFKDLAVGIFQLVPQAPVTAVGLNFHGHFKLASEEEYHLVGDRLAPKDFWQRLFPDEMTGLANLTIRVQRGVRGEPLKTKDEKNISVQPSKKIRFGVFLSFNDHHDVSEKGHESERPAELVGSIIDNEWERSWKHAIGAFDELLSSVLGK